MSNRQAGAMVGATLFTLAFFAAMCASDPLLTISDAIECHQGKIQLPPTGSGHGPAVPGKIIDGKICTMPDGSTRTATWVTGKEMR